MAEEINFIETRKNELQEEAQRLKDRYVDNVRKLAFDFEQDWQRVTGKLGSLNQEVSKDDKINK